jgi:hypothetical protein
MAHDVPSFAFSRSTKAVEVIGITKVQANSQG